MRSVWFSAASVPASVRASMLASVLASVLLMTLGAPASAQQVAATSVATGSTSGAAADRAAPRLDLADRVEGEWGTNLVAFTFDDGPDPHTTPMVLDALARYEIPATFFIVNRHLQGWRAAGGLPVLRRVLAEGHLIGSHTTNHARLRTADPAVLQLEIDDSVAALAQTAGVHISLFRPPYGVLGPEAAKRLRALGLTDVRWSIDPQDFDDKDGPGLREAVMRDIVRERGGVVLLHDTKRVTAGVIDKIFGDLERDNCRRLARGGAAIIPVSIHYFLRDDGVPRPVPREVEARTAAYRQALEDRCKARGLRGQALAREKPLPPLPEVPAPAPAAAAERDLRPDLDGAPDAAARDQARARHPRRGKGR